MGRNKTLAIGLAVVVASSSAGWIAATQIRSPAEIAARTAPPKPSLITVAVEKRPLSTSVVVRGTVRYGAPQVVTLPLSPLKKTPGLLTTVPVKGAALSEGSVGLAVSGRPVFVLQGDVPAYRDISPGVQGNDVKQLEASLARLGFDPGPQDGVYDDRTEKAVAAMYLGAGWTPLGPTEEQLLVLRSAQTELYGAQSDVALAQEAVANAAANLTAAQEKARLATAASLSAPNAESAARAKSESERALAEAEIAARRSALETASGAQQVAQARLDEVRAASTSSVAAERVAPEASTRLAAAEERARLARVAVQGAAAAEAAAQARDTQDRRAAAAEVASRKADLDKAIAAERAAQRALDDFNAAHAAPLTPAEQAQRDQLQKDLTGAAAAALAAEDAYLAARAAERALPPAPVPGALTAEAKREVAAADAEVARARSALSAAISAERVARQAAARETAGAVAAARAGLRAATAAEAAIVPPVVGSVMLALAGEARVADAEVGKSATLVSIARRTLARASQRAADSTLSSIKGKLGVQVPADEILFFPSLPLRVDDVKLRAGEEVRAGVMTVTNSRLAVDAALAQNDAKLVENGADATIVSAELGIDMTGEVTDLATTPGTRGVDPQRYYLEVTPNDAPNSLVGASVVLTVTVDSTNGDVLAVPVAALSVKPDGTSRVQVQARGGARRYVTVRPGLAAQGLVAVTPVGGTLGPGDLVVVGRSGVTKVGGPGAVTNPLSPTTTAPAGPTGSGSPTGSVSSTAPAAETTPTTSVAPTVPGGPRA